MSRVFAILGMVVWVTGAMLYDLALSTVGKDKVSRMKKERDRIANSGR